MDVCSVVYSGHYNVCTACPTVRYYPWCSLVGLLQYGTGDVFFEFNCVPKLAWGHCARCKEHLRRFENGKGIISIAAHVASDIRRMVCKE